MPLLGPFRQHHTTPRKFNFQSPLRSSKVGLQMTFAACCEEPVSRGIAAAGATGVGGGSRERRSENGGGGTSGRPSASTDIPPSPLSCTPICKRGEAICRVAASYIFMSTIGEGGGGDIHVRNKRSDICVRGKKCIWLCACWPADMTQSIIPAKEPQILKMCACSSNNGDLRCISASTTPEHLFKHHSPPPFYQGLPATSICLH